MHQSPFPLRHETELKPNVSPNYVLLEFQELNSQGKTRSGELKEEVILQ